MSAEGSPGTAPAIDEQHPWLGLASFTEESRAYFHGREEEVAELGRRVQRKLLTILFGQSGLGKTSILRAGIVPRLRPEGYCPVYVRVDYSPESPPPTEQIKQAIFRATESSGQWTQPGTAVEGESLWEFLHHRDDILKDANGRTVIPLLIFDQFEEIFTLAQADDAGKARAAQFLEDLADLVENRPPKALEARLESDDSVTERFDFGRADYRILIALREDYLAHLEGLKGAMPSITQNRMRLARMNGQQALAAVMKPGGRLVSEEVAESIVRFIAGGSELRNAEVEPSLLSLICRELNNARLAQGRGEISADLLAGSHDTILAEFYERSLADQPPAVRKVIEDELLTESGYRESLAEERVVKAFAEAGAAPDALATLVNRRLLRIEERLDVRRVELTHDVLCGVVRASRGMRLAREARENAEAQLEAQRAREAATRKALVRARQVAAVCAVLALGAVVSAIFGYVNMNRAKEAEAKAQQTRQMAESARGESEKLLVYLLDDFVRELDPVGRIDIVASLAKRALDYYKGLPPELRTPDTERNRAMALVRYGAVARRQGQNEEGMAVLKEAEAVFRKLRAGGDDSEPTRLGLANALGYQAAILIGQLKVEASIRMAEAALAELLPLVEGASSPSNRALREYGDTLTGLGYATANFGDPQKSAEYLRKSQEVFRKLGAPKTADLSIAAGYASATAWLASALDSADQRAEARAKYEEALEVSNRILDAMPGHATAMHVKGLALSSLTEMDIVDLRIAKALARARENEVHYDGMVKVAATNTASLNNLGVARTHTANALLEAGRIAEARDKYREAASVRERMLKVGSFQARNAMIWLGIAADFDAELGEFASARAHLAEARRLWEQSIKPTSAPLVVGFSRLWLLSFEAGIALHQGDPRKALQHARSILAGTGELKPASQGEREWNRRLRIRANQVIGLASLELGDFAAAEAAARAILADQKGLPKWDGPFGTDRDRAGFETLLAAAVAKQGRLAEAREILRPALKHNRDQFARRHDSALQRFELAQAVVVAALAEPERRSALLAEASALLDSIPPALSAWKTGQRLRAEIAKARRGSS
ncbi:MAG: hypothetical protein AB7P08_05760 [Burkholderiales bacterium]